jgi:hypothetical protein
MATCAGTKVASEGACKAKTSECWLGHLLICEAFATSS